MNFLFITLICCVLQSPLTVVKNNGEQVIFSQATIFQQNDQKAGGVLRYSYRGEPGTIRFDKIKRISFKETVKKSKGVVTYKVILVRKDNSKLEVEMDMLKVVGTTKDGQNVSMNFSSVDKISF